MYKEEQLCWREEVQCLGLVQAEKVQKVEYLNETRANWLLGVGVAFRCLKQVKRRYYSLHKTLQKALVGWKFHLCCCSHHAQVVLFQLQQKVESHYHLCSRPASLRLFVHPMK